MVPVILTVVRQLSVEHSGKDYLPNITLQGTKRVVPRGVFHHTPHSFHEIPTVRNSQCIGGHTSMGLYRGC